MTDLDAALAGVLGGEVTDVVRLSGGASRETWSFTSGGRQLILQRRRPGSSDLTGEVDVEVDLLRSADAAGVPVPEVIAAGSGASDGMGAPWMVCEHVAGEALPRPLLRDDAFARVRGDLAFHCGAALARIHAVETTSLRDRLEENDPIARLREVLDLTSTVSPSIELGFRWLELHPAPPRPSTLVHGDFRTGNLLVQPDDAPAPGLSAVLDWELAHLGNPVEDLGWFCVRAWRFGSPHRAGGFGSADQLLDGYASVAGERIDPAELDWWELFGTLRWGVICAVQAESHLSGAHRSVELAAIGRRTCENEYDALALIGASFPTTASAEVEPVRTIHGRPTATELIEAVREFLTGDVMSSTDGRARFHARVAANALAIVERELAAGPGAADGHAWRLMALGVADDEQLAAAIRAGDLDDRWDDVRTALAATVVDKLRVANPRYLPGI